MKLKNLKTPTEAASILGVSYKTIQYLSFSDRITTRNPKSCERRKNNTF